MDEKTLIEGLEVMKDAIDQVAAHGPTEVDSPAWPTELQASRSVPFQHTLLFKR